jgi:hypothetical protein
MALTVTNPDRIPRIGDVRAGIARAERERCISIVLETARGFARAAERYPPGSALADDLLRKSAAASAVALALRAQT